MSQDLLNLINLSSQSPSQLNGSVKRQLKRRGKKRRRWSSAKQQKRQIKNDTSQSVDIQFLEKETFLSNSSATKHSDNLSLDKNDVTSPTIGQKQSCVEGNDEIANTVNVCKLDIRKKQICPKHHFSESGFQTKIQT